MEGFFKTGSIHDLYRKIDAAIAGEKYPAYFKHRCRALQGTVKQQCDGIVPYSEAEPANGTITLIDRGYEDMLQRQPSLWSLWLVTDNVQDPQGQQEEKGDIEKFYSKLRARKVKQVSIFPTALPFNGKVYGRRDKFLRNYPGERGVIIYAILFDKATAAQEATFQESLAKVGASLGLSSGKGIQAKPIEMTVEAVERELDTPGAGKKTRAHLVLDKSPDKVSVIKLTSATIFPEGAPIEGTFRIEFLSQLPNISVTKPDVYVKIKDEFAFADFRADRPDMHADPPKLEHDLLPGISSNAIKIHITFPQGVRLERNLGALWRNMFKSEPARYTGSIEVGLKIQKNQLALVREIRDKYSTQDERYFEIPEHQKRIYDLEKLFSDVIERQDIDIIRRVYQITFLVQYSAWPVIVFGLLVLGVVALLVFLLRWVLGGSPDYRLENVGGGIYHFRLETSGTPNAPADAYGADEYGAIDTHRVTTSHGEPVRLPLLRGLWGGGHSIWFDDHAAAKITRSLGGIRVQAVTGYAIDGESQKVLRATSSGTDFTIMPQNGGVPPGSTRGVPPSSEGRAGPVNEPYLPSGDYPNYC